MSRSISVMGLDGVRVTSHSAHRLFGSRAVLALDALAEDLLLSNKEWIRLTYYRQAESTRARPVTTSHPRPTSALGLLLAVQEVWISFSKGKALLHVS